MRHAMTAAGVITAVYTLHLTLVIRVELRFSLRPCSWVVGDSAALLELAMRRATPASGAIAAALVDSLPACRMQFQQLLMSGGAKDDLSGEAMRRLSTGAGRRQEV